jgi:aarF domain-containing kinase
MRQPSWNALQVHKGTLRDGREVAVKVQYPGVGYAAAADLRVCSWVASALNTLGVSGVAPMQRILKTLVGRIRQEVDLRQELKNCERLRETLSTPHVVVPTLMPDLSSHRVLVMEWIDGVPLIDAAALQARQIDPRAVGNSLLHAFADMVYVQGRMHGDMHPANVLVRGQGEDFQVVLLDHGWHVDIPNQLRKQYCQLWCAFVLYDMDVAAAVAEEIAGPKARHIVPTVLHMASGGKQQGKGNKEAGSSNDGLRVLGGLQHLEAVSLLPVALVEILRSFQNVRALVNPLGLTSGDRLRVNCRYALQGIAATERADALRGWQRVRCCLLESTEPHQMLCCSQVDHRAYCSVSGDSDMQVVAWARPWQSSNQSWKEWRFSVRLSARITLLRGLLWARSMKDYLMGHAVRV